MKIAIVSPFSRIIRYYVTSHKLPITISSKNPDVVVAFGGDGTFLEAEEKYPNTPKLLIKYHKGDKVEGKRLNKAIHWLFSKKSRLLQETKVEANVRGKGRLIGLNEINLHYKPPQAIRLTVEIDGKKISRDELIGDGLVVATPYGSSAYFKSITGKTFAGGLGLAFNNLTKRIAPKRLSNSNKVKIKITRGKGTITADCSMRIIPISAGDEIIIKKHAKHAKILHLHGHEKKIPCTR